MEIARLMVAIDMYLTGDGQGSWEDELTPVNPGKATDCPGDAGGRRLQANSFVQDASLRAAAGKQPVINRPLLMSRTAGLSRSLWSIIISTNTFQRDRFERAARYYFARVSVMGPHFHSQINAVTSLTHTVNSKYFSLIPQDAAWVKLKSGIEEHGLEPTAEIITRTSCDDSCPTAADGVCSDGGFYSEVARRSRQCGCALQQVLSCGGHGNHLGNVLLCVHECMDGHGLMHCAWPNPCQCCSIWHGIHVHACVVDIAPKNVPPRHVTIHMSLHNLNLDQYYMFRGMSQSAPSAPIARIACSACSVSMNLGTPIHK